MRDLGNTPFILYKLAQMNENLNNYLAHIHKSWYNDLNLSAGGRCSS